jgi:hypothetical protein
MPRRMSCSLTVDAVRNRTKTVTRRRDSTWMTLQPGDRLTLIEKGMGLAKGEKQVVLAEVEVVDVRLERLWEVSTSEVRSEGLFAEALAAVRGTTIPVREWFIQFWLASHGYPPDAIPHVRRIEWRYLDDPEVAS